MKDQQVKVTKTRKKKVDVIDAEDAIVEGGLKPTTDIVVVQVPDTLKKFVDAANIAKAELDAIILKFSPYELIVNEWKKKTAEIKITDVSQTTEMAMCADALKLIKAKNAEVVAIHKDLKDESLRKGQLLDAIKRHYIGLLEPLQTELDTKARFKEIQEAKERAEKLDKRLKAIEPYGVHLEEKVLIDMLDDVFENYVETVKKEHEQKLADEKAAEKKKLEEEAAEKARVKKLEEENKKLKAQVRVGGIGSGLAAKVIESITPTFNNPNASDKEKIQILLNIFEQIELPVLNSVIGKELIETLEVDLMAITTGIEEVIAKL